jgi:hypothetical protein
MMSAIGFRCRGDSKTKIALNNARDKWAAYFYNKSPDFEFDSMRLDRLSKECERLEYELWCEEYEEAHHRNWR